MSLTYRAIDAVADEQHLAGQFRVAGASPGAGLDERKAMTVVGPTLVAS
jgi:hypothetical protein